MPFASINNAYQSERRMTQFRARIWKRIHKDQEYRSWLLNTKDGFPVVKQLSSDERANDQHDAGRTIRFCDRLLQLPGEIRNQIYDELLEHQSANEEPTPLFRSIFVTKRSHAAASFSGSILLPVSRFAPPRYIGRHPVIWAEIFSKWASASRFHLLEAFELLPKSSSLMHKLLRSRSVQVRHQLPFQRYVDDEVTRIFEKSIPWFPIMETCSLTLHVFNIGVTGLRSDGELLSRLCSCMKEVAVVLAKAPNLKDLDIDVYLWPDEYAASSSMVTWRAQSNLPKKSTVWGGLEPLKHIRGVQRIAVHAGPAIAEKWIPSTGATTVITT